MTGPHLLLPLLQAVPAASEVRDFALYVADGAALGAFGFAWRTNARLMRIETLLGDPDTKTGIVYTVREHGDRLGVLERQHAEKDGT